MSPPPRYSIFLGVILFTLLCPLTASANAGTPLMWFGMLHLFFGNLLLGAFESSILCIFLRPRFPHGRTLGLMILANYVSAWLGFMLLGGWLQGVLNQYVTIENLTLAFYLLMGGLMILTMLIELPFIWFAQAAVHRSWKLALQGTVLVHVISYPLLLGGFWLVSGTTLLTDWQVVPAREIWPGDTYRVYYLDSKEPKVWQWDGPGSETQLVHTGTQPGLRYNRLFPRRTASSSAAPTWELMLVHDNIANEKPHIERLIEKMPQVTQVPQSTNSPLSGEDDNGLWLMGGTAPTLSASDWSFRAGFWAIKGLSGENNKAQSSFRLSLDTLWLQWNVRSPTALKDDAVIFQLGQDQICLLRADTKKIALLTRGKSPLVLRTNTAIPAAEGKEP